MAGEEEVSVKASTSGVEAAYKGNQLNTVATIAGLIVSTISAYVIFDFRAEAREKDKNFIAEIQSLVRIGQEGNAVHREMNCLLGFPEKRRAEVAVAELCRKIAR